MNFDAYAEYYDLVYQAKDYSLEARFVDKTIKQCNPNAQHILELGCGTGKHAEALTRLGYIITGIDISERMIEIARCTNMNAFLHADLRTVRLSEDFDVVISLFDVMSYQISDDDMKHAFATASYHLNPGGVFIFDVWHGPGVQHDPPVLSTKVFEYDHLKIRRTATPTVIPGQNLVNVKLSLTVEGEQSHVKTIEENHYMRYFFPSEIEAFAIGNKFSLLNATQWHADKMGVDDRSWKAIYILRKDE